MTNQAKKLTPGGLIGSAIVAAPYGALLGGLNGVVGRCGVSFFSPVMASAAGTFGTFASMGALAAPLTLIPSMLLDHAFMSSAFLKNHSSLKNFLYQTSTLLLAFGAACASAAILGTAFVPSVTCMMAFPTALYALSLLCEVVNKLMGVDNQQDEVLTATAV